MSSSLIVEVCKIKGIKEHPNADLLQIAVIKGWETIIKKNEYKTGDVVIYIPVDAILPSDLIEKLNISNYLTGKEKNRVRCAKLRGEMSYGLIIPNENSWEVGKDVSKELNIIKYEPPLRAITGDAAPEDALFNKYTDIENINNFPEIFKNEEMVVVTEKIDGTSGRSGAEILEPDESGNISIEIKAGSHKLKRKRPSEDEMKDNIYWYSYSNQSVKNLFNYFIENKLFKKTFTLYGEIYGRVRGGHKSLHYGKQNSLNFVAFDLMIDGKYMDWYILKNLCDKFEIPTVPIIGIMKFNLEELRRLSMGDSILAERNGAKHMREGIVIKSLEERQEMKTSRAILKMLNPDYLILKNKKADKGEEVDFTDE